MIAEKVEKDHLWIPDEAAERIRRHPGSIRRACRDGSLHGEQPVKGGHWLIEEQCLQAYKSGKKCVHRSNVTKLGRRTV